MMSRSRDTKQYLVCLSIKNFLPQSLDPQDILNSMYGKVEEKEIAWHGFANDIPASVTMETCSPFTRTFVMSEMIKRTSRQQFKDALSALLLKDQATILPDFRMFQHVKTNKDYEALMTVTDAQLEALRIQLSRDYKHLEFLEAEYETLKLYTSRKLHNAYTNLCMLAKNGSDFESALISIETNASRVAAALNVTRKRLKHDESVIARAQRLAGVLGGNYDLDANQAAAGFVKAVTGATDPFKIRQMNILVSVCIPSQAYIIDIV